MSSIAAEKDFRATAQVTPSRDLVRYRRLLTVVAQSLLFAAAYVLSFLLRFDFSPKPDMTAALWHSLPLVLMIELATFQAFGLLAGWWRYVGTNDIRDISIAAFVSAFVLLPSAMLLFRGYPRSVAISNAALVILFTGAARLAVRNYTENAQRYAAHKNTIVVGAGRAGCSVVRELKRDPVLDLKPIGFVDDDRSKRGLRLHGVKVLGSTEDLKKLIAIHDVRCVLIAIPGARGEVVERIIDKCRECRVDFKILPPLADRLCGRAAEHVRAVQVEDLLGREPVRLDMDAIRNKIEGQTLLVTGAAGSIGSELARQIASVHPKRIVLLDRSENDLFKLSLELRARVPELDFVPVIADVLDVTMLKHAFGHYRPDVVFHAAAYKHVPMMERHCFQAVTNNVFGTYNVALMSREFGAKDFVLISSDKAVNPTNVMGVTKRIAELVVLGLQHRLNEGHPTRFLAVRFGNVLGSNGSVLPIFQQQIAAGGPLTVTDPEAMRYFMTIPEAVQLVLQAASFGNGGEIFILDMGERVRIVDVARKLLRLAGFNGTSDTHIVFTGLRPGEKLIEELATANEDMEPTAHNKIRQIRPATVSFDQVQTWLADLSDIVEGQHTSELVRKLREIVPEYVPSADLLAQCEVDRHDVARTYQRARTKLQIPA